MDKLLQIIPVSIPTVAVYVNDDGSIFRNDVDCWGLKEYTENAEKYQSVVPLEINGHDHTDYVIWETDNFLGFERNGKEEDWTEEIKERKTKKR